jgi:hypothetical protein
MRNDFFGFEGVGGRGKKSSFLMYNGYIGALSIPRLLVYYRRWDCSTHIPQAKKLRPSYGNAAREISIRSKDNS